MKHEGLGGAGISVAHWPEFGISIAEEQRNLGKLYLYHPKPLLQSIPLLSICLEATNTSPRCSLRGNAPTPSPR